MADEDAPQCKVEFLDTPDGAEPETANWLSRPGRAKVTYPGGTVYEGGYDGERKRSGEGKYTWVAPAEEEGEEPTVLATFSGIYVDGRKTGVGCMTFPNGDKYTGAWVDNRIEGEGTYEYKATGDIYSGAWQNGKKHGRGIYQFGRDESLLEGIWEVGALAHGGKWTFADGTAFAGGFKDNQPLGAGVFSFQSGIVQKGKFVAPAPTADADAEEEGEPRPAVAHWVGESIVVS
ncbi:unnamed protein product [Phaeothamnion confervicola]